MIPKFLPPDQRPKRPLSVMEQLATPVNISAHGHAEYTPSTDAQRLIYRSRQEDMMEFQVQYNFIFQGLQDMLAQAEGLVAFRAQIDASPILSEKGKQRAHKALGAYLAGDWDTVADTLPTIEAAIRQLSLSSGINIYAPAGEANEFKALTGLLLDLEGLGDDNVRLSNEKGASPARHLFIGRVWLEHEGKPTAGDGAFLGSRFSGRETSAELRPSIQPRYTTIHLPCQMNIESKCRDSKVWFVRSVGKVHWCLGAGPPARLFGNEVQSL